MLTSGVLRRLVENGAISAATLDRICAEQLSFVATNANAGAILRPAAASILAFAVAQNGLVPVRSAAIWVAVIVASHFLALIPGYAWKCRRKVGENWRPWSRVIITANACAGLSWGIGSVFLITYADVDLHRWMDVVVFSVVGTGIALSVLPAFYAGFFPSLLPWVLWCFVQGGSAQYLGALGVMYLAAFVMAGRHYNRVFIEALRLRFENLDLVDQLRLEKTRAEQANIDRSRFLASASHDLRQPVHALSMLVGALQAHNLNAELIELAGQMNKSVIALDNLFASLLDISKFDANVVRVDPKVFYITKLVERVCDDYRMEAQAKGIRLSVQPSSLVVRTDSVLMERILRNLVSNAVRYTMHGRVVVGCRRGQRVSLQVWDTGRGIPEPEQTRIFEEFYQLDNPERDRDKGLGLGLAIAKRSAELLGCELTVCSKVGVGSVFGIAIPTADEIPVVADETVTLSSSRGGGLILVVDDEVAVQAAMSSLLSRWGYDVIAAGSGDALIRKVVMHPTKPRLIICDYRLRGEEDGITVVRRLRSEYNDNIPAMLITGDTAPDRLKDEHASGLYLLHKPVGGPQLRDALAKLLPDDAATGDNPAIATETDSAGTLS